MQGCKQLQSSDMPQKPAETATETEKGRDITCWGAIHSTKIPGN